MGKEGERTPEQLAAAIKEIIESFLELEYQQLLDAYLVSPTYLEYRDGTPLTEEDLIADILDDGKMLGEEHATFDDIVIAGASGIAFELGFVE